MSARVIDFHTHLGKSSDASLDIPSIVTGMDRFGIECSIVFPINQSSSSPQYTQLHEEISRELEKYPGKLAGFLRPVSSDKLSAQKELDKFESYGFCGIKLHPLSDGSTPENSRFVAEFAQEKRVPIIIHTAHNKFCTPQDWAPVASEYPDLNLVFAHSGRSLIEQAIEVAKRFENVYFDTSINIWFNLSMAARELSADRFVFGSDLPYASLELELHKVKLIWKGEELDKVLFKNALRLLKIR